MAGTCLEEGDLNPNNMNTCLGPSPQIYVACLASYNRSVLFGRWVDAAQSGDELREEIRQILEDSPTPLAEEWAVHDHEGFGPLDVGEHPDLDELASAAELICQFREIAAHVLDDMGGLGEHERAQEALENLYVGAFDSVSDWVHDLLDEGVLGEVSDRLRSYVDSEALARDLELSGDIQVFHVGSEVHVFWSH